MTPEKRDRIKEIRHKLANLTEEQKRQMTANGMVATVEGRVLSFHNTILVHIQAAVAPTVVGGYQQWKRAGRHVKAGEHGLTLWFPVGDKDADGNTTAERFFTGTVFDISQTELNGEPAPESILEAALA